MKLSFVALVVLLSTVAGIRPSRARRTSPEAQRSNVAKSTVGYSFGGTHVVTILHNHPAVKSDNSNRGNIGKTHHHQRTPASSPKALGKFGIAKSNKAGKTKERQNANQPTRSSKWSLPTRNSKTATRKSGYSNSFIAGEKQQQQTTSQKKSTLKPPKTEKSVKSKTDEVGKTQQQRKTPTTTFRPPKTGMSGNSNIAKEGKTQHQQHKNTPMNTGKGEKSGYSNGGRDGKTDQNQKATTNTLTSTFKPPTLEKAGNSSNTNVGQSQQKLNGSQSTSTLKPPSAVKPGNTSSVNVGETSQQQNNFSSRTELHHHYHYSPPQQISYGSTFYPVYQGYPPVYVYEYRDSGSRFDNLLTGLALYNLGLNSHRHNSERQYSSISGEICKLGISKPSGLYEETRIDCNLMSSFIWEDTTSAAPIEQHVKNTTVVTITKTVNGTGNSSVTVTSSIVEDALKVKGPSIAVTPGMICYMIRTLGGKTVLRKPVDCGLLQEYARSSLHRNVAQCLMPFKTIVFSIILTFIIIN